MHKLEAFSRDGIYANVLTIPAIGFLIFLRVENDWFPLATRQLTRAKNLKQKFGVQLLGNEKMNNRTMNTHSRTCCFVWTRNNNITTAERKRARERDEKDLT